MPKALLNDLEIHYEVYGTGQQSLIILNGIMMSTASWKPFMSELGRYYQVILMDFIDQGQSSRSEALYTQELQVEAVRTVLDALKLEKSAILGISYGGEIAIQFSAKYPTRVSHAILANTTAFTHAQLREVGEQWIQAAQTHDGSVFFKATIPPIYSWMFYEREIDWLREREKMFVKMLNAQWYDAFIRLVKSAEFYDARALLSGIKCPLLIIGSEEDLITPIPMQRVIHEQIKGSKLCILPKCGHASMYEQPELFFGSVHGFLAFGDKTFQIL